VGLLIPVIVGLIEMYEWRVTMRILALGTLVVLPLSLLFRHKPEQYGYLPDGQAEGPLPFDNGRGLSPADEVDVKAKQAIKSSAFWYIAMAFTYHMMLMGAIITHVMPYLSSIGVSRWMSSLTATAIPLISIGGRLGLGWLGDKVNRRLVASGAFAIMGLGSLCFGYASDTGTWLLVPFLILFSIGYGGNNALRLSLVREYFGRTKFGTIFGLIMGINALGGIIGPTLAGWTFDNWGSYRPIWFIFAGLAAVAVISMLTTPLGRTVVEPPDKAQL
jgi:MFS family permease